MYNIFHSLTQSDCVQIFGIMVSCFTSIVAIIISVKSLKQNSKMIEESSRPYVSLSTTTMNGFPVIVLKNYGNSSAVITDLKSDIDLPSLGFNKNHKPFNNIAGTHIAPKQSLVAMFKDGSFPCNFTISISYKHLDKTYTETIPINIAALQEIATLKKQSEKGEELSTISNTLQEIESIFIEMK